MNLPLRGLNSIKTRSHGSRESMGSTASFNDVMSSMGGLSIDGSMQSCGEDYYQPSFSGSLGGGSFQYGDNYQFPSYTTRGSSSSQSNFQDFQHSQEPQQPATIGGNRIKELRKELSGISRSGRLGSSFRSTFSTNSAQGSEGSQRSEGRQRGEGRQRRSSRNDDSIAEPQTASGFMRMFRRKGP